jgi:dienelactone hydrolase
MDCIMSSIPLVAIVVFGGLIAVAVEFMITDLCFWGRCLGHRAATRLRGTCAFVGLHAAAVLLVLAGGFAESRFQAISACRDKAELWMGPWQGAPPESFHVEGDPGLTRQVEQQQPILPRPDVSAPEPFIAWQGALRTQLLNRFELNLDHPRSVDYEAYSRAVVADGVRRTFLAFSSVDGTKIPAYLFSPPRPGRLPAVLVLHGHVRVGEQGISHTGGLVPSYAHGAALALARAGFVTLTLEFRGFGYLGDPPACEHRNVAYNAIVGGSFYKAILAQDIRCALDLLQSLESVDPERLGITGVSLGGEVAVNYAALDQRVRVVVFQQALGAVGPTPARRGGAHEESPHYCHVIPGENRVLHREDWFLLIAPRPMLGVRSLPPDAPYDADCNALVPMLPVVGAVYRMLNADLAFQFRWEHGGHEYFPDPAVEFFRKHL